MSEQFSPYIGHLVKIVFRDGDNIVAKRGRLVSVSGNFVELHTLENAILIRASEILKIQRGLGGQK